jgi:hypothetical protein
MAVHLLIWWWKRLKVNNIYIIHMLFLLISTARWTSVHPNAILVRPKKSKVHCEDKIDRSIDQSKIPVSTDAPLSSQDRRRNDVSFVRSDTPLHIEANSFVKSEIKRWQYLHLPGMNGQNKLCDSYLRSKLVYFHRTHIPGKWKLRLQTMPQHIWRRLQNSHCKQLWGCRWLSHFFSLFLTLGVWYVHFSTHNFLF